MFKEVGCVVSPLLSGLRSPSWVPMPDQALNPCREAYQILSNPDSRAFYDKVGRAGMKKTGGEEDMVDPQEIFSKMFGGGAFFAAFLNISSICPRCIGG